VINKIESPLLISHGIDDDMVPIEHGQALYQHSKTKISPLWVPSVGHNNLENSELLWTRVREFIRNEAKPPLRTAVDELEFDPGRRLKRRKSKHRVKSGKRSRGTKESHKKSKKSRKRSKDEKDVAVKIN